MTAVPATLRLRRESVLRSRAAGGDAAAFAAVYERHHQALYRYCRSILRHDEDAQDALQSTMARAFAALQQEQRDFELRPWLFRIAHNEAISILRRRRTTTELEDLPGEVGETETRVAEREELRILRADLADLPERQRAALVLRELNGLSHAEIGVVLELTPAAVKQAIFEARSALFSCREGREMACRDVRRMLSDGDGRVLRGRGMRAHLRTCPDCRRFRDDLVERPAALKLLAPPLPTAGAAALLSQILGGGGTAAKLLACVAIAGGGTTLAVELRDTRGTPPPARAAGPKPTPRSVTPVEIATATPVAVVAREPASATPVKATAAPEPPRRARRAPEQRAKRVRHGSPPQAAVVAPALPAAPPAAVEEPQAEQPAPVAAPAGPPNATPPGQAKKQSETVPPGQAKKEDVPPAPAVPPGQAKREDAPAAPFVPPGQAKKEEDPPPGQAKQQDDPPPGQAKPDKGD